MTTLDLFLLLIAIIVAFDITKEIFTIRKGFGSEREVEIFFENTSIKEEDFNKEFKTRGLTLVKKKNEKFTLMPQSKLYGFGLS